MRIGILCYPSVGGSGIVATELAKELAARGHEIHIFSTDIPFRLHTYVENIFFHQVETPAYPLFKEPPYLLTLANKLVEVHRMVHLDLIHAHYAVPHATAAFLAREMIGPGGPKIVTTLHGTDITLLGSDPTFAEVITFSIDRSDGVSAVSHSLMADTKATLPITRPIEVIHNFLDCSLWRRLDSPHLRQRLAPAGEKLIMHISNFRKVKRVTDVIRIFAQTVQALPARLILIGDGPEVKGCIDLARTLGVRDRIQFMGSQENVVPLLSVADLFLLPSSLESFGLAALEAMACGVPVIGSDAGGLPEVVVDGETGYLLPVGDADAMAKRAVQILSDPDLHREFSQACVERVQTNFCAARIVPEYEDLYRRVLDGGC